MPVDQCTENEVQAQTEEVYRVYPTLPSPYYATVEVALELRTSCQNEISIWQEHD